MPCQIFPPIPPYTKASHELKVGVGVDPGPFVATLFGDSAGMSGFVTARNGGHP